MTGFLVRHLDRQGLEVWRGLNSICGEELVHVLHLGDKFFSRALMPGRIVMQREMGVIPSGVLPQAGRG